METTHKSLNDFVKEMKKSKTIFESLEFKDKGIVHFKNRLNKVPKAFVNRFSKDINEDGKEYFSFNISTIVGNYVVTTENPNVAKHLASCYVDNLPFDLFKTI